MLRVWLAATTVFADLIRSAGRMLRRPAINSPKIARILGYMLEGARSSKEND